MLLRELPQPIFPFASFERVMALDPKTEWIPQMRSIIQSGNEPDHLHRPSAHLFFLDVAPPARQMLQLLLQFLRVSRT